MGELQVEHECVSILDGQIPAELGSFRRLRLDRRNQLDLNRARSDNLRHHVVCCMPELNRVVEDDRDLTLRVGPGVDCRTLCLVGCQLGAVTQIYLTRELDEVCLVLPYEGVDACNRCYCYDSRSLDERGEVCEVDYQRYSVHCFVA